MRNLKAYRNEISDNGALALASLISHQCSPLEELHLSHNGISGVGAAALFKSFTEARSPVGASRPFVYPRYDITRAAPLPVWIRLEYNKIAETQQVLKKWEAESKSIRRVENPQHRLACFADRCAINEIFLLSHHSTLINNSTYTRFDTLT